MTKYLIAIAVILLLISAWVALQGFARRFSRNHPEFGPLREGLGCGSGCCGCSSNKNCKNT